MKLKMKKISLDKIRRHIFYVWIRHYKLLFFFLFLLLTGFSGYQWQQKLYRYSWTSEQRKAYLDSTAKETAFQEEEFINVLNRLEADRSAHAAPWVPTRDLFEGAREKDE